MLRDPGEAALAADLLADSRAASNALLELTAANYGVRGAQIGVAVGAAESTLNVNLQLMIKSLLARSRAVLAVAFTTTLTFHVSQEDQEPFQPQISNS